MNATLDQVLGWLLSDRSRVEKFKNAFSFITDNFPDIDEKTKSILRTIQEKGLASSSFTEAFEVVGQKSYGWEENK